MRTIKLITDMYTVQDFYIDMCRLYESVNTLPFSTVVLPIQMKEFGDVLEKVLKQDFIEYKDISNPIRVSQNCLCHVAFSGGKDSVALAVKLKKEMGLTVVLKHITGLNKAYPDERRYCESFAEKYGFPITVGKLDVKVQKGSYVENPVKNNLLIAYMMTGSLFVTPYSVGLGCASEADEDIVDFGFSDSANNLQPFARGVKALFDVDVHVDKVPTEGMSYKICVDNNIDFGDIISCMMPVRYRGKLRQNNLSKGLQIRPGGCGQCYKCGYDYFYLTELGYMSADSKSDEHYIEVMRKHWDHYTNTEPITVEDTIVAMLYGERRDILDIESIKKRFV